MYKKFNPMAVSLSKAASQLLGKETTVRLRILKTYEDGLEAIVTGGVDFMRMGPASYILAKQRDENVQLLAMELKKGKKRFQGVVVVGKDSAFQTLADLKGASFAFGDPNSTIGRYLVQDQLVKAGVFEKSLRRFEFLGRHDKVAKAVALGDFDAGSVKMSTFKKMNRDGTLRILQSFENVTKPWVARPELEDEVAEALRTALLETSDADALKALKASGFAPASDAEYEFVREGMKSAETFSAK